MPTNPIAANASGSRRRNGFACHTSHDESVMHDEGLLMSHDVSESFVLGVKLSSAPCSSIRLCRYEPYTRIQMRRC